MSSNMEPLETTADWHDCLVREQVLPMVKTGGFKSAEDAMRVFGPVVDQLKAADINILEILYRSKKKCMGVAELVRLIDMISDREMRVLGGTMMHSSQTEAVLNSTAVGVVTPVQDAQDWVSEAVSQGKVALIRESNTASVLRNVFETLGAPEPGEFPDPAYCTTKASPWRNYNNISMATEASNAGFDTDEYDPENFATVVFTGPALDVDPKRDADLIYKWVQFHGRMPVRVGDEILHRGKMMPNVRLASGVFIENGSQISKVTAMRDAMQHATKSLEGKWKSYAESL